MKKLLVLILALCMVMPFVAACGKKEPAGNTTAPLLAWTMHAFEKTVVNIKPDVKNPSTEYTVYLAKGETEGCQVAVYSETQMKNVTFKMKSGETELIKPEMFVMSRSHAVGRKQYTDSLISYNGLRLMLNAKTILPFMIEFTTDENTPAGEYKYVYELKDKDKNVIATFNITVHVWDFELPKEKTFIATVGLGAGWVHMNGGNYERWYNDVLDHNMCAYSVPYGILDERGQAYMSDPRVTSFVVPVPLVQKDEGNTTTNEEKDPRDFEIDVPKLMEYYNTVCSNPEWLKKAYFYPIDEPRTKEHLEALAKYEKQLTALCPKIEICAPFYTNLGPNVLGGNKDQTEIMAAYTDLWCPKLCLWDDKQSYDAYGVTNPKSFEERMNDQIAKGDRMWTYVCNDPDDPYAQMFIDTKGVNQRLMFWQMYQRNINGFLYWSVNTYGYKEGPHPVGTATPQNPWNTVNTKIPNGEGKTIYGCGFLFYPGSDVGVGGAVPSIRAKIVRDGVDDLEMFYLAEEYLDGGKEWLVNKTKEGTPSLTKYCDNNEFVNLRIEIGNAIEAAVKNSK